MSWSFHRGVTVRTRPWLACGYLALQAGCAARPMPDPRDAARAYAAAAERGDAEALHGMMTSESRQAYGEAEVRRLVADSRDELRQRGRSLREGPLEAEAQAELAYPDGEAAVLHLEAGTFRVGAAGTLPAGAVTPGQALAELRLALARRSYPALARVLGQASRMQLEDQLTSLVRSLEHPESADIAVQGDRATIELPEGHRVTLRREQGVWKVEDFR